jgi:hypothetical protein
MASRLRFTAGSPEGVRAVVDSLPDRYEMRLSAEDMETLVRGLAEVSAGDGCAGDVDRNPDDHVVKFDGTVVCRSSCWRDRAGDLLGSIAESLGIEWI